MRIFTASMIVILLIPFAISEALAQEEIWITISDNLEQVNFDGKWSFTTEWKHSSLDTMDFDSKLLHLRHAHQENFIYFMIDFEGDENLENGEDKAMICLNPKENQNPDEQFCFIAILETENPSIISRNSNSEDFKEIKKPADFIAVSSASDENDRYSKIPHSSYEFRIPTELVGRSSEYGFYLAVHEANSNKTFTFPSQVEPITFDVIPDASNWAKLISPDKSLPEFHWAIIVIISSFTLVIFISRTRLNPY
jgi:hypothetical protein